jgi:hypothetical protein
MHTDLMAEIVRSRSEELQRRAASVRIARAAAARHPRRRPSTRRRPDLFRGAESIAVRLTRGASGERLGAEPPVADLIGDRRPNAHERGAPRLG